MQPKTEYTITIYSENQVGLLNQISTIFTRRHINIESLTTSESALEGIHKFTVVVFSDPVEIEKLVKQIEKRIDIIKAYYFTQEEIIYQEVALYKVPTEALFNGNDIENLVRKSGARILEMTAEYAVIEKTGHKDETQDLFNLLEPYGVSQFTRSGRIAVNKLSQEPLTDHLKELAKEQVNK